ncbi:oxepin-CoA hydrolase, alternative type [Limnohabitans sp.]|uniref:oxepin-CoA hydrolase, alternative type n=1 Tax=Limnohabitans sp. TaxID=1907725 RepID=UPI00286F2CDC|nr:enoyl-CoA hydratase [Limnohabitans sp.]
MSPVLVTHREGPVLVLSHHNVAARNALSFEFYTALTEALHAAAQDPSVGAIVLTGEGGHFCSGGDLRQLAKRRELHVSERRVRLEGLHDLIRSVRDCPKPVIAAVEGAAAGAGLSLAMACDMLVAAEDAMFTVAYVKVGLTPDGGATAFLAEFVSRQVLTELCLTGMPLSGERMHVLGAVNRLVASGQALPNALALAADISKGPQQSMAHIKQLCRHAMRNSLDDQLELEARFMVEAMGSDESLEGIRAFLDKRQPNYTSLR